MNRERWNLYEKRVTAFLLAGLAMFGTTACSIPSQIFSDSGSNVIEKIDTSQYLDLEVLKEESQKQTFHGYEVYNLEYGTFETAIAGIKASINRIETSPVKAEVPAGTMYLLELAVEKYQFVSKGDVIALVSMETSALDLEELELKLTRMEEDYTKYLTDYEKCHEEALENISVYELPGKIDRTEIAQMELDHSRQVEIYEKQLQSQRERISEQKELSATKEILAPQDGYVLSVARLQAGQELANGTELCTIAPADKIILEFADETNHYGFGMNLTLSAGDRRYPETYEVEVVSALGKNLYGNWNQTTSIIHGDYDIGEMMWKGNYLVTGKTNVMENVLLVPVDAVIVESNKYYVNVLNGEDTLMKKQFIPGGKNADYYWVFDGLEAGMQIMMEN